MNDAFGSAHRAHASTEGITHYLKPAVAGLLMEKEITYLGKALEIPEKPFVAIIGGSKISGKIDVIDNLLDKVDTLVIVGGMAYTFQRALGVTTGKSLVEEDKIDMAKAALDKAKAKGVKLLLPVDNILADNFAADAKTQVWDCVGEFPGRLAGARHWTQVHCRRSRDVIGRPRRLCGMGRQGCLSFRSLRWEPTRLPMPWRRTGRRFRSSAAAIR